MITIIVTTVVGVLILFLLWKIFTTRKTKNNDFEVFKQKIINSKDHTEVKSLWKKFANIKTFSNKESEELRTLLYEKWDMLQEQKNK